MSRQKNHQKLSIIMACYNASRTISESIESIYRQKIPIPFEVILIDDASTDNSLEIIRSFERNHAEVHVIRSPINRGGGASRNAGVQASTGTLIFCLDADDILPDEMLPRLIHTLVVKKLDGVIFEESKFFISSTRFTLSAKNTSIAYDALLQFSDLFASTSFLTQVNFLYTRHAFDRVGGYPTLHGFDTQEFGHRFLALGLRVGICPGSYYFHRQGHGKSYFEREYERGMLSLNYYLLLESVLFCFQPKTIEKILEFDCFLHSNIATMNLQSYLRAQYTQDPRSFYSSLTSLDAWLKTYHKSKRFIVGEYVAGCRALSAQDFTGALDHFLWVVTRKPTPVVRYNIIRCIQAIESGKLDHVDLDRFLTSITPVQQVSIVSQSLPRKIIRKIGQNSSNLLRRLIYV